MEGNKKLIEALNQLLADEITGINQYMVHSEMCANFGYPRLQKAIGHQAHDEMHHAQWLIQRIIFLNGFPVISQLKPIQIGKGVPEMIEIAHTAETEAVRAYNATINLAREVNDHATVDLLSKILTMEEEHVDLAEQQREQIKQMGVANFLANQAVAAAD